MSYDARLDTYEHIGRVRHYLGAAVGNLLRRADAHDRSKLDDPERATFDEFTPRLRDVAYGSPEYEACRAAMGSALEHHYAHNSHHPEHYEDGICGMSLLDLVEMLVDWKAAGERHTDGGDVLRSIAQNQERFGYGDELRVILANTAREMGFLP